MRVDLIKIGNSKGVRLPKPLLDACGFVDSVELEVRGQQLILSPSSSPRAGWAEALGNESDPEEWSEWQNVGAPEKEGWDWPEDFKWPEAPIVSKSGSSI